MTTEPKDDFGLCRDSGPADGLHEIANIMDFVEHALIASRVGDLPIFQFAGVDEGLTQLTKACRNEIRRIAEVCPVSIERDVKQAAE